MKVLNQCRVTYSFQPDCDSPVIRETIFSNLAETIIIEARISVKKEASCTEATFLSTLVYEITVQNDSRLLLNHLTFSDILSCNAMYLPGTFKLNGCHYPIQQHLAGIELPPLPAKTCYTLSFKVRVNLCECLPYVCNTGIIEYDHIFSDVLPPLRVKVVSNTTKTLITSKIIQEIQYESCECIQYPCYDVKDISIHCVELSHTCPTMIKVTLKFELRKRGCQRIICCYKTVHLICTKPVINYNQISVFLAEYDVSTVCCCKQKLNFNFILTEELI